MKVWILEKFADAQDARKTLDLMVDVARLMDKSNMSQKALDEMYDSIKKQQIRLEENPGGYWYGFEGKFRLEHFKEVARAAIERNPNGKFRVVLAEIEDGAKYWIGYKNGIVRDDIMQQLKH